MVVYSAVIPKCDKLARIGCKATILNVSDLLEPPMRRELAIEFSRVTEAAALAGYKWLGRGDKTWLMVLPLKRCALY